MRSDPWSDLRRHTPARIALGRTGSSLPTSELLAFAADHAAARDAVYSEWDLPALIDSLAGIGLPILSLQSRAADRATYLKNPDLGRRLDDSSAAAVSAAASSGVQVSLIIGDGLSAVAGQRHAAPVVSQLIPRLQALDLSVAPICVVRQARVAIQDQIGSLLKAKLSVILIGERPGLGAVDGLGAYLVHEPAIGKSDAQRNCISNIRTGALAPSAAAEALAWLIEQSLIRRLSGVDLKDDRHPSVQLAVDKGSPELTGESDRDVSSH